VASAGKDGRREFRGALETSCTVEQGTARAVGAGYSLGDVSPGDAIREEQQACEGRPVGILEEAKSKSR
jgi:hypothetical protein